MVKNTSLLMMLLVIGIFLQTMSLITAMPSVLEYTFLAVGVILSVLSMFSLILNLGIKRVENK